MIPFVDLKLQYQIHKTAFEKAILQACASADYILGPDVKNFEKRFADFLGVKEAVGLASGTDALRLVCEALGLGPGDEVLIPANTFVGSIVGFCSLGAVPVPVDVDPKTYLMDLVDAERRITGRTKAIMPVHLFGQSMDMDAVEAFAQKNNLLLVEDACQAHGASWNGKRVGGFGSAGCFSFYPGKNMGAFGDGGLVATNDSSLAERIRLLRNYGSVKKYVHEFIGTNSRLDTIHAAILNVKLDFIDAWNQKRFRVACRYTEALQNVQAIQTPVFDQNQPSRHVFHLYVIQLQKRDQLLSYLNENGIQCGIHYPVPIHLHKAFSYLNHPQGSFPVAERLADRILSLPMFPEMSDSQIDTVVNAITKFFAGH